LLEQFERLIRILGCDMGILRKRGLDDLLDIVLLDLDVDDLLDSAQYSVIVIIRGVDAQLFMKLGDLSEGSVDVIGSSL
jgi:hypothetical protein